MTIPDDHDDSEPFDFKMLRAFLAKSLRHLRLLGFLVIISVLLALLALGRLSREYSATATIAPATSLGSSDLSSGLLASATSGLSAFGGKSLLGGAQVSPYEMFLDVLSSKRLAQQLAQKDHFLEIVFAKQWDARAKRWIPQTGPLTTLKRSLESIAGLATKDHPDIDDLSKFLARHLVIASKEGQSTPFSAITQITFSYKDPAVAQQMLDEILDEAASMMRTSRRTDVQSRITYLRQALPTVLLSEQRQALISVLSNQEEEYTVLEADKRYAFTLLDPPFASATPTFPNPGFVISGFILGAIAAWCLLVAFVPESSRFKQIFTTKKKGAGPRPSANALINSAPHAKPAS